ncbi:unnamed protein product [Candidula unifasciata]|uniref:RING-type domain-containing protein n=1 Tax=Candidula unifasciata TaxID=100452 RepID=A0A8S3ZHS2_9EUPU|nr:unnamed protein product [Candidula unifasciata]
MPTAMSLSAYFINYTSGSIFTSVQINSSSSHLLTILTHTTAHPPVLGQNNNQGNKVSVSDNGEDDDSFGEHYFHICIYIWACVVVSSLIALSVKWGCCGRSLTRWEVKRIPLKRFQRVDGEDSQDRCPICHEEFHEERLIRQLPCNHCYHSYCVDRWLVKMSNRCPLCKQRVSISVLCPWNKQRRKQEVTGFPTADMEAAVDESPPIPPLATLTPSNWYGEEIMSGPSKFIILRPGRPTRVIDVRQKKPTVSAKSSVDKRETSLLGHVDAVDHVSRSFCQHGTNQMCSLDVGGVSSNHAASENILSASPVEADDVLEADVLTRSASSSRSCSISSEQSLLLPSQICSCGSEGQKFEDLVPGGNNSVCSTALLCLVHSRETSSHTPFSYHKPEFRTVPPKEYRSTTHATVTLCSRSNSVVSFSSGESDTNPALHTPASSRTKYTTSHSASVTSLNKSECAPVSAFYHKRHTLPATCAETLTLLQFTPSHISDDVMHDSFTSVVAMDDS